MYVGVHYKIEKRVNGNRDQKFPDDVSNIDGKIARTLTSGMN